METPVGAKVTIISAISTQNHEPNRTEPNRTNTAPASFLFYCRPRLLAERIFRTNSRVAQAWACGIRTVATRSTHSITLNSAAFSKDWQADDQLAQASPNDQPGGSLPASFHGFPYV